MVIVAQQQWLVNLLPETFSPSEIQPGMQISYLCSVRILFKVNDIIRYPSYPCNDQLF